MPATGYSRTPKLLKGALIYFGASMILPLPNIIVFQYNPESMTRTLTPWKPLTAPKIKLRQGEKIEENQAYQEYMEQVANLAQPYDPEEQFSLVLEIDATDALEEDRIVAKLTGVADRLAAIEMLMYPPGDSLLGGLLSSASVSVSVGAGGVSASASIGSASPVVERKEVPVVLFFWGPGRIIPVRVTALSIEEQQYSPLLYPIRAKATIGLRALTMRDLVTAEGNPATGFAVDLAEACYKLTRAQKEVLAQLNLANAVESIAGMLPI
jgi:hypothetical protein